ncbi:MAG: prepilin-type N-terminal cleavage/methylation domain-containing protein [Glaciecola sp.]|jgi:prepilin-type N-terminal cleavage/methylation domain-containing protein
MQIMTPKSRLQAGFTLIEIMAVLVILGILSAFLVGTMMRSGDVVRGKNTRMFMDQIETMVIDYESEKGDYPTSSFPSNLPDQPSNANMGSEMLILSFYPVDNTYQAIDVPEDRLCNTDEDASKKALTSFSAGSVFEFADDWGNPIAYIHRRDYGKKFSYVTFDGQDGSLIDNQVQAIKSLKTGDHFHKRRFQLISAGPDGMFGGSDDIHNFTVETE